MQLRDGDEGLSSHFVNSVTVISTVTDSKISKQSKASAAKNRLYSHPDKANAIMSHYKRTLNAYHNKLNVLVR